MSTDKDFAVLADTPRLLRRSTARRGLRQDAQAAGVAHRVRLPDEAARPVRRAAVDAGAYLNEAEYIAYRSSRIRSWSQFLLVDDGPITSEAANSPRYWGTFQTGLIGLDGRRKPAYNAYRLPIFVATPRSPSGRFTVWGGVRAAANGKKQKVDVQYRRAGTGSFVTLKTVTTKNARGYFPRRCACRRPGSCGWSWNGSTSRVVAVSA